MRLAQRMSQMNSPVPSIYSFRIRRRVEAAIAGALYSAD
jgi:hypothetical protein